MAFLEHDTSILILVWFQVFHDKMRDAQQEIKSTVTVNTSDIAAKAHEDKDVTKVIERLSGKRSNYWKDN